jgi:hypothetical protein
MYRPAADLIVIDTLGKLYAHGYGLTGYCRVCRRYLKVPMLALIVARGADSPVAGIVPLTCAGCGGRETVSLAHIAREKVRLLRRDAICSDVGADPRSPARGATSADALSRTPTPSRDTAIPAKIISASTRKPALAPSRAGAVLSCWQFDRVRSVKEECLSKIIFFGERSLRRALGENVAHYHAERNHQGKSNVLLFSLVSENRGQAPVQCRERLGGLLRFYHRTAA